MIDLFGKMYLWITWHCKMLLILLLFYFVILLRIWVQLVDCFMLWKLKLKEWDKQFVRVWPLLALCYTACWVFLPFLSGKQCFVVEATQSLLLIEKNNSECLNSLFRKLHLKDANFCILKLCNYRTQIMVFF